MRYQLRYTQSLGGSRMASAACSDWVDDRDASEKRGRNTAPIQEEELRYYDPKIDPDDRPSLHVRVLLMTFLDEGDVENVKRMLTFSAICTPDFLNRVDHDGGIDHRTAQATFLTAALASRNAQPEQALAMANLLVEAGCTAWSGAFNFAGDVGYTAFHMLFLPRFTSLASGDLKALVQRALSDRAKPHYRVYPLGKTAYEVAQKHKHPLLALMPLPPEMPPRTMKIMNGFWEVRP